MNVYGEKVLLQVEATCLGHVGSGRGEGCSHTCEDQRTIFSVFAQVLLPLLPHPPYKGASH